MCGIWLYLDKGKQTNGIYELTTSFNKIKKRGPDRSQIICLSQPTRILLGFHRLAIKDLSGKGDQPFVYETEDRIIYTMTNGEIYNHHEIIKEYDFKPKSTSDCEVIPLLYLNFGIDGVLGNIDGEWAIIIVDINKKTKDTTIYAARDEFGVRPLFYGIDEDGISFSSEMKGLYSISKNIKAFEPGKYMKIVVNKEQELSITEEFDDYTFRIDIDKSLTDKDIKESVKKLLTNAVVKRLDSDRPIACLLSGGLDSSLVSAIAANELKKTGKRLHTFSIGMPNSPDVYYAEMVSKHINSIHTVVPFNIDEALKMIPEVVQSIESYDITTVRASICHYILLSWIAKNTDIKVVLSGEQSDECTGGYIYFHNASNAEDFNTECIRLIKDIYLFDSLRADRCIANNGIEARVPFSDLDFNKFYLSIDPQLRMPRKSTILNVNGKIEKAFLREAFVGTDLLPEEILKRQKEAFSCGVFSEEKSWYQYIQEHTDKIIPDKEFQNNTYTHLPPPTKEAYYYRKIFEDTYNHFSDNSQLIPYYWLPKWSGNIKEPCARVLEVYQKPNKIE